MKKKTILLTTLAGTMIVAGMTATGVKAAVGEATKAIVNEDKNLAIIEYSSEKDQLTRAELEKLVNARYTNAGVSATVAKIGDTVVSEETGAETVGTGTTVELNNNKKLTVVVYGDVTGEG